MTKHCLDIGVVVTRRKLQTSWAGHMWLPYGVLPAAPAVVPWTLLSMDGENELYYADSFDLTLHRPETAHYRDNLGSGRPSLWVSLRLLGDNACAVSRVTANPYDSEALTEDIGTIVDAVPMPNEIQATIGAFIEIFHVERPFIKRERDRADPEMLRRRPPARDEHRTQVE
jgi:hypothetical protein